ncbi:P-loop containing nucleoside triphosphate hydrolase protein [Auriculariales sp. MPI-PUGE-AT-0066]|nr:P-loop containing nucleoside triphosphate hydrolase protein [Auriculariales sp. MPI-PUGE-AT-0066]
MSITTELPPRIVLVLCGLVGAGKSSLADALVQHEPTRWVRCCQDELKRREKVEASARDALAQGLSPIIDRTNITAEQRSHWTKLAHQARVPVYLLFLNTPPEQCYARIQKRQGHPTVKNSFQGLGLIRSFGKEFEPPSHEEGFHRLLSCQFPERRGESPVVPMSATTSMSAGNESSSQPLAQSLSTDSTSMSFFGHDELQRTLRLLSQSIGEGNEASFVLSGPLPRPAPKKNAKRKALPSGSHEMDIRKHFPISSAELAKKRAQRIGESSTQPDASQHPHQLPRDAGSIETSASVAATTSTTVETQPEASRPLDAVNQASR